MDEYEGWYVDNPGTYWKPGDGRGYGLSGGWRDSRRRYGNGGGSSTSTDGNGWGGGEGAFRGDGACDCVTEYREDL